MTTRDNIMTRLTELGTLNNQNTNILQQLTALKAENVNMLQAMRGAILLLGTLITTRANLDEILTSANTSFTTMDGTVQQIINILQGAPTTDELTEARVQLEGVIRSAGTGPPDLGQALSSSPAGPRSGGYSYKPYNSKRPGSYKASMKKSKKKYSKRRKQMTK